MSKHTPAPWIIRDVPWHATDIITEDLLYVCQVYGHKNKSGPMTANARLIAAAPELLQALLNLVGTMCAADGSDMEADLDAIDARVADARAAIAKATGETA
jgi:hypothetical protein